jgi:phosphonate transport system permease protein
VGFFAIAVVLVWVSGRIEIADLFGARRRANLERFLTRDAMPFPLRDSGFSWDGFGAWAGEILRERGLEAMIATLWISALAIVIAGAVGALFSVLGAHTLMTPDPYGVANPRRRAWPWRLAGGSARVACVLLRAIPEYVWAFLLLAMLGPNAWPAVIALAIHNAGILGRLGAETVENLDAAPLRALAAAGASRSQLSTTAVLPLALPRFLLYFFYRFETCVREATVLGMLGAISLGYWIQEARGRQHYDEMLLLVALGAVLVLVGDFVSFAARRWLRRG